MEVSDGLMGGIVRAQMDAMMDRLISKHGGVQGIVALLQLRGLHEAVQSWIGPGTNLSISAEQVREIFGADMMADLASRVGLDRQAVAQKIAQLLPEAIDKRTPGGVIPTI